MRAGRPASRSANVAARTMRATPTGTEVTRMTNRSLLFAAMLASASLGLAAQDAPPAGAPQAKRTVIDQHEQSDVPNKEIILGTAELPAGGVVPWHMHDGDESGYVLKGKLILKTRGKPDQVLNAGDHFFNPRGAVHSLVAAPDGNGGTALSTWIIDKGKPLAEPVK